MAHVSNAVDHPHCQTHRTCMLRLALVDDWFCSRCLMTTVDGAPTCFHCGYSKAAMVPIRIDNGYQDWCLDCYERLQEAVMDYAAEHPADQEDES